jgi:hypothetical protein
MFSEEDVRIIALDTESRVRGVCQLMEGVIFNIRLNDLNSEDDITLMVMQFNSALQCLNKYIIKADNFLEKHKRLKRIGESEVKKYQNIVKKKRREVAKVLKNEYSVLGLPELENFCKKIDF